MLKIDKTTHMMILFTFGLVFVSIYLYYTIVDVRRVQTEMKRLLEDNEARKAATAKEIEALSNAVMQLSVKTPEQKPCVPPVCEIKKERVQIVEVIPVEKTIEKDDDSVITEDIRKSLECDSDEDVDVEIEAILESEQDNNEKKSQVSMTEDKLQTMKYEELRDMCKEVGISYKGVKDVLYKRLHEHFFGATR